MFLRDPATLLLAEPDHSEVQLVETKGIDESDDDDDDSYDGSEGEDEDLAEELKDLSNDQEPGSESVTSSGRLRKHTSRKSPLIPVTYDNPLLDEYYDEDPAISAASREIEVKSPERPSALKLELSANQIPKGSIVSRRSSSASAKNVRFEDEIEMEKRVPIVIESSGDSESSDDEDFAPEISSGSESSLLSDSDAKDMVSPHTPEMENIVDVEQVR